MTYTIKALKDRMSFVTDGGFKTQSKNKHAIIREFVEFSFHSCFYDLTDAAFECELISYTEWAEESLSEHGLDILLSVYGYLNDSMSSYPFDFEQEDIKPECWEEYGFEEEEEELMAA